MTKIIPAILSRRAQTKHSMITQNNNNAGGIGRLKMDSIASLQNTILAGNTSFNILYGTISLGLRFSYITWKSYYWRSDRLELVQRRLSAPNNSSSTEEFRRSASSLDHCHKWYSRYKHCLRRPNHPHGFRLRGYRKQHCLRPRNCP